MKENRLEGVLTRNRKHLVIDVALAAFFLMALVFSGLAFGSELPKLSMKAQAAPAETAPATDGLGAHAPCDAPATLAARWLDSLRAGGAAGESAGILEVPPLWLARLTAGFSGRVVDEYDRPLAGAVVVAINARPGGAPWTNAAGTANDRARRRSVPLSAARPAATASTEADGRFALPILPPGRYVLFALHVGPPPATSAMVAVDGGFLTAPLRLVIARERPALL